MKKEDPTWKTKDGRVVRVCDMTDSHLLNTIRFLERQHAQLMFTIPYPNFNGEMAQICAEQEWEQLQNSNPEDTYPILSVMYEEVERRNIKIEDEI